MSTVMLGTWPLFADALSKLARRYSQHPQIVFRNDGKFSPGKITIDTSKNG